MEKENKMNVNKKTDEDATLVSDWDINATVKEGHIQGFLHA